MFQGMWTWIAWIVAWAFSRFFSHHEGLVPLAADPPDHASASRSLPKADPSDVLVNKESSSSSFDRLDTYDVFLNHRGTHCGKFVGHLYEALCMAGFRPFVYAKSLVKGQHTFNYYNEALWGVRVHVAIFSKDYAESKYCLEELCDMLKSGKLIFPVYLDVDPEDLQRPHKGAFACAFRKHLKLGRKEDVKRWEQALLTATNITGFRLCEANGDEVQLKRKIVMAVQHVLPTLGLLQQAQQQLVGLQGSVMEVANQLDCLFQQAQPDLVRLQGSVMVAANQLGQVGTLGALTNMDETDALQLNDASTLQPQVDDVKRSSDEYTRSAEDSKNLEVPQSEISSPLQNVGKAKHMVDVNQSTSQNLHTNNLIVNPLFKQFTTQNLITFGEGFPNILGEGAFAHVYVGQLQPSNQKVAIKVLKPFGTNDEGVNKSFETELHTLGSIHHVNLVRLLGYSVEGSKHMLVYEYMSNSSLDKWLFNDGSERFLDWNSRMRIILGVAQGLAYLHHGCNPPILHLDIKPQNILLDGDYIPKLADFGLAKFFNADGSAMKLSSYTTPGTYGYMAPEIFDIHKVSTKSDVYSFGVVLIELVRGKRNFNQHVEEEEDDVRMFTKWARMKMQQGRREDIFKSLLNNSISGFNPKEAKLLMEISLMCIKEESNERPNMQHVVQMLARLYEDTPPHFANFQQNLKGKYGGLINQKYCVFRKFFLSKL